jgi:drug/metabolite transporter (DMT)-like permease
MVLWFNKFVRNVRKQALQYEKKLGDENVACIYYLAGILLFFYPTVSLRASDNQNKWYIFIFWRGVIGMVLSHLLLNSQESSPHIGDSYTFRLLMLRATLLAIFQVYLYFALPFMPLTDFYLLINTLPIFFFVLKFLLTREPIIKKELLGIAIALVGIVVAIYPEMFGTPNYDPNSKLPQGQNKFMLYSFFLIGVLLWSASITNVKYAKGNKFSPYHVTYFMATEFSIFSMLFQIFHGIPFGDGLSTGDFVELIIVFGILNTLSQYLTLRAIKLGNVGKLTLVGFILVIISFILDYTKFDESFNGTKLLGAIITLLGIVRVVF